MYLDRVKYGKGMMSTESESARNEGFAGFVRSWIAGPRVDFDIHVRVIEFVMHGAILSTTLNYEYCR